MTNMSVLARPLPRLSQALRTHPPQMTQVPQALRTHPLHMMKKIQALKVASHHLFAFALDNSQFTFFPRTVQRMSSTPRLSFPVVEGPVMMLKDVRCFSSCFPFFSLAFLRHYIDWPAVWFCCNGRSLQINSVFQLELSSVGFAT